MKQINIIDNTISILENEVVLYTDSIENMQIDSSLTIEMPRAPWTGKLYVQNVFLRLYNNFTEKTLNTKWPQGDLILQSINQIIEAKKRRLEPPVDELGVVS